MSGECGGRLAALSTEKVSWTLIRGGEFGWPTMGSFFSPAAHEGNDAANFSAGHGCPQFVETRWCGPRCPIGPSKTGYFFHHWWMNQSAKHPMRPAFQNTTLGFGVQPSDVRLSRRRPPLSLRGPVLLRKYGKIPYSPAQGVAFEMRPFRRKRATWRADLKIQASGVRPG